MVIIGGLIAATLLTLIVLPTLYFVIEDGLPERSGKRLNQSLKQRRRPLRLKSASVPAPELSYYEACAKEHVCGFVVCFSLSFCGMSLLLPERSAHLKWLRPLSHQSMMTCLDRLRNLELSITIGQALTSAPISATFGEVQVGPRTALPGLT